MLISGVFSQIVVSVRIIVLVEVVRAFILTSLHSQVYSTNTTSITFTTNPTNSQPINKNHTFATR